MHHSCSHSPGLHREQLQAAITRFEHQMPRMDYATNVKPNFAIGSGVTKAACNRLIQQRSSCSRIRWKEKGPKTALSLCELTQTAGRRDPFWKKVDQYDAMIAA
ncbi:hypothetical protein [uncultured Microbulbifer sp.]|uniref:hypothetical protein n=1 Tax=uncultured Microbulbifer sp. TaxID=348147 RepID=UPI00263325C8|nr:hypothetical protein [uncultured Microbulbifer sp.]